MTLEIKDKRLFTLEYPSWEHGKRLNWLMRNANLTEVPQEFSVDDNGEKIRIEVFLDEVVYNQYLKTFEPKDFEKVKHATNRMNAPKGW